MPKKAKEVSAIEISRLNAPGMVAVGGVAGLYLHINKSGAKSWILRSKIGSKRRDMGLGGFPDVTLAGAKEKARRARDSIELGIDPITERKQAKSALSAKQATEKTFRQAALEYIDTHRDTWANVKHAAQWTATLETYAFPFMGDLLVCDVGQAHVLAALEPIWKTKTETATRVRGRIEKILDYATVRKYRTGENPARWKGHLEQLLPAPGKITKVEHHRALPVDAMGAFMADLRQREGTAARALEFAILCASRSGEVRGAKWSEFDLDAAIWVIPAVRMKAKVQHRVPLSAPLIQILNERSKDAKPDDLLFPAPRGGVLSDMTLTALTRRMGIDAVPHGFRSTFRDWAAERTNFPRELAEQALAHKLEDKVEAAYLRSDQLEKRRALMQSWADHCDRITTDAKVIPFQGVAA
ncbi:tyrosine-type recombinase/integrase [Rhodoferax antarcticus]|uniref:Phage integrase n=1 Tax=Rhodoferax antarcticus ANT.BR TaxID=1111071 RepID=A0A1Q8YBT1_9BURK|nr:site-specific integrase [Rhodoferax antarcticus]APW46913.1 integrase [Rhodoferax antarcticus]OLP05445.1 phage integrase [Rhodoferax antarcticus ANT.BR]